MKSEIEEKKHTQTQKLKNNKKKGTLPSIYDKWFTMNIFVISENKFVGDLPISYAKWCCCSIFDVSRNELTDRNSSLQAYLNNWRIVNVLDVSHNQIKSSLPNIDPTISKQLTIFSGYLLLSYHNTCIYNNSHRN